MRQRGAEYGQWKGRVAASLATGHGAGASVPVLAALAVVGRRECNGLFQVGAHELVAPAVITVGVVSLRQRTVLSPAVNLAGLDGDNVVPTAAFGSFGFEVAHYC